MSERRSWHWNHNAHFHPYVLERLPLSFDRGLEVGCGTGTLARTLAQRARQLEAIDTAPVVVEQARRIAPQPGNIRWLTGDVMTYDLPLGAYDVVTAVASLHHLPLEGGLRRLGDLVRPGGRLAVVGLARASSLSDYLLALATVPIDPVIGAWKLIREDRLRALEPPVPLRDPTTTMTDVAAAARRHLPGATLRRHLFYRYTLIWQKPDDAARR